MILIKYLVSCQMFQPLNSSLALPFDQTETNKKVVDYFLDFL